MRVLLADPPLYRGEPGDALGRRAGGGQDQDHRRVVAGESTVIVPGTSRKRPPTPSAML